MAEQSSHQLDYEGKRTSAPTWLRRPPFNRHIATAIVGLLLVLLLAVLSSIPHSSLASEKGNRAKCAANLRAIGVALQMYAQDDHGLLLPDLEVLMVTQARTPDFFLCPSSSDERATGPTTQAMLKEFRTPGHCSYVLAAPLPETWNALTSAHVMAYEPLENHGNGTDGMTVLFGDGHAEFVIKPQADYILAELKAGFNPPRNAK